jgi:hypothetical protein
VASAKQQKDCLALRFAEVEFPVNHTYERMKAFYTKTATISNLEHLFQGPSGPWNNTLRRVKLLLVGLERLPSTVEELVAAVKTIYTCLFALFKSNYVHCDVRWANIVEVLGS